MLLTGCCAVAFLIFTSIMCRLPQWVEELLLWAWLCRASLQPDALLPCSTASRTARMKMAESMPLPSSPSSSEFQPGWKWNENELSTHNHDTTPNTNTRTHANTTITTTHITHTWAAGTVVVLQSPRLRPPKTVPFLAVHYRIWTLWIWPQSVFYYVYYGAASLLFEHVTFKA